MNPMTKIKFNRHVCEKDHAGETPQKIANLPESQAGVWRHRCAACAYAVGLADGLRQSRGTEQERNALEKRVERLQRRLHSAS